MRLRLLVRLLENNQNLRLSKNAQSFYFAKLTDIQNLRANLCKINISYQNISTANLEISVFGFVQKLRGFS